MKQILLISILIVLTVAAFGQNERKFVRNGNKLFMEAVNDTTKIDSVKFSNAETEYRKALNKKPNDSKWDFNLADALYKQQKFDDAAEKFESIGEKMETLEEKARAFHNLGNSQLMKQKLDESIESYKKALRQNPSDLDTKYNLAYAQMLKKKKEEQEKKQNKDNKDKKNQDKDKDKKNQDKKDQDKKNQDKNQDKKNKDKKNQDKKKDKNQQNKDQQKQQQQKNKISKQDAEQLLQALQNDEKKIQDKVKKAKAAKAKRTKVEKEW